MKKYWYYLPEREGLNALTNNKPLNTITKEAFEGTDEENRPSGEAVGGKASEEAKGFANIFGN